MITDLGKYDVVYVSGTTWGGIRYRKQLFSMALAKAARRVYYFERMPTRRLRVSDVAPLLRRLWNRHADVPRDREKVIVVGDLFAPEYLAGAGLWNRLILAKILNRHDIIGARTILIVNTPGRNSLRIVQSLKPLAVVYD